VRHKLYPTVNGRKPFKINAARVAKLVDARDVKSLHADFTDLYSRLKFPNIHL